MALAAECGTLGARGGRAGPCRSGASDEETGLG
jgi:hypothetical protein